MTRYSISQLARKFKLSRSTLLHYDTIGILKAASRTSAGYRVYTEKEFERLRRIISLRRTGISLEQIRQIIDADDTAISGILHRRLEQINGEISALRFQQQIIARLINEEDLLKSTRTMTKKTWVDILKKTGLDEEGMRKWHIAFEQSAPEAHQDFLESLGLSAEEIERIKRWC